MEAASPASRQVPAVLGAQPTPGVLQYSILRIPVSYYNGVRQLCVQLAVYFCAVLRSVQLAVYFCIVLLYVQLAVNFCIVLSCEFDILIYWETEVLLCLDRLWYAGPFCSIATCPACYIRYS